LVKFGIDIQASTGVKEDRISFFIGNVLSICCEKY